MYGHEKSDRCVVPWKSANKAGLVACGGAEGGKAPGQGECRARGHGPDTVLGKRGTSREDAGLRRPGIAPMMPDTSHAIPAARARCGKAARRDPCGGWAERPIPIATTQLTC